MEHSWVKDSVNFHENWQRAKLDLIRNCDAKRNHGPRMPCIRSEQEGDVFGCSGWVSQVYRKVRECTRRGMLNYNFYNYSRELNFRISYG
ncbi:hypothetical protein ANTQUA_LOCUS483 [Anthophora quadrimaculata]